MSASRLRFALAGVGAGALAVTLVTLAVELLDGYAPVLSLGVLYVFAVLPMAIFWGTAYAVAVAVASMLAFNFLFLPPLYTFTLADSQNWVVLVVYLVTAVVAGELAGRARSRAAEAEQREREASFLARASALLLESRRIEDQLPAMATGLANVLGAREISIELGSVRRPDPHQHALDLAAGKRHVGRVFLDDAPDPAAARRVLPGLASLLAVAGDRERLARRALEAETLRRSDAIKTAILRAVSHDLRSPLTAILTSVEALADTTLELTNDDRLELLDTVHLESKRLARLVDNLLDLSRLEAGAARPNRQVLTLDDLVGRALLGLGPTRERVVASMPDDLPAVRVDGSQIERVLVNVLENALKFSSAEDIVELRVARERGDVVIRVADHGPGIREADLGRIFEPFEHGIGRPVAVRGAGLGLAIARGFAQANGGVLWAESEPGTGATFVLALPEVETPAEAIA